MMIDTKFFALLMAFIFVCLQIYPTRAEPFDIVPADCDNYIIRLTDDTNRVQSAYSISGSNFVWAQENILDYDIFFWDGTSITTLTTNGTGFEDTNPDVDGSNIVWQGYDGNDEEIFYYDGTTTTQITNNSIPDTIPEISGTNITWNAFDGTDWEIFYYDGTTVTQVTNNNIDEQFPQIEGNYVVWDGFNGIDNEIYLWDGATVTTLGTGSSVIDLGDGKVVWSDAVSVHYWDIATSTETIIDFINAASPQVSSAGILWQGFNGIQWDMYFWDGTQILRLTDTHVWSEFYNLLSGTHAVWNVDDNDIELFYVDLSNCTPATLPPTPTPTNTPTVLPPPTPAPTSTASATGGSSNTGAIAVFDPTISKIGFLLPGQAGVTGEQLEWVVTVSNIGSVTGQNITVTDTLIAALRIERVDAPNAVVNINGQTVAVTYPVLNVGETQQFSIITTVLDGVEVNNTACVSAANQTSAECASSSAIVSLPQTGESPMWRSWLWFTLIALITGIAVIRRKLLRP